MAAPEPFTTAAMAWNFTCLPPGILRVRRLSIAWLIAGAILSASMALIWPAFHHPKYLRPAYRAVQEEVAASISGRW